MKTAIYTRNSAIPRPRTALPTLLAIASLALGCDAARPGRCADASAGATADVEVDAGDVAPTYRAPFPLQAINRQGIGSENSVGWPAVGTVSVDIDWKQGPFAGALLVVDPESACYPFEQWAADPPPPGQNWPADCDAFDRNMSFYIDDTIASSLPDPGAAGADDQQAGVPQPASSTRTPYEIVHAITPFGGPEHLEVDLTDLANALPGKHTLRVDLSSYSDARASRQLVSGQHDSTVLLGRHRRPGGTRPAHLFVPGFADRRRRKLVALSYLLRVRALIAWLTGRRPSYPA